MPRNGWPRSERGLVRDLHPVAADSPITIYRLADYSAIFSLYLNAVENVLHDAAQPSRALTDDWRLPDKVRRRAANGRV
jgi:hypothetical protein